MSVRDRKGFLFAAWIAISIMMVACSPSNQPQPAAQATVKTLVLAAYTVPKEAYEKEIIPAFCKEWKEKTGQEVKIEQSYVGSGAQARAVVGGFSADIAALSLEGDIRKIEDAGLINHDWTNRRWNGFITHSLTVIAYRPGNPKGIHGWEDLTQDTIDLLYANPKTSGGAQWFVNAIYGAGLKMSEAETGKADPAVARDLLKRIQKRVKVMDKSARQSTTTFERGIGDALITYENEALLRQKQGREFPFVSPDSTILIQNPIAVIDRNADQHGVRELADAFVEFCHTDFAQRTYARYGFRPANPEIGLEFTDKYPVPPMLFDIAFLGGWPAVLQDLYGPNGVWTEITNELARE